MASLLGSRWAGAEPAVEGVPASHARAVSPQQRQTRWYGGSILAGDALGYAALGGALLAPKSVGFLAITGAGVLLVNGPIQHVWRYRWGTAAASFGMRVGLGLAGAVGGALACDGDTCSAGPLIGLLTLGMVTATSIDAAALAYEPVPASVGVTPTLSVARDRVVLGAVGSF